MDSSRRYIGIEVPNWMCCIQLTKREESAMHATTVAIDLAKGVFELAYADDDHRIVARKRLSQLADRVVRHESSAGAVISHERYWPAERGQVHFSDSGKMNPTLLWLARCFLRRANSGLDQNAVSNKETRHEAGHDIGLVHRGKVRGIDDVDLCLRCIAQVRQRTGGCEIVVATAPEHQHRHFQFLQRALPERITLDVGAVVKPQIVAGVAHARTLPGFDHYEQRLRVSSVAAFLRKRGRIHIRQPKAIGCSALVEFQVAVSPVFT